MNSSTATTLLNADLGAWGDHHLALASAHKARFASLDAADRFHAISMEYATADSLALADDVRNAAVDAADEAFIVASRAADGVLEAALDATRHARRGVGTV